MSMIAPRASVTSSRELERLILSHFGGQVTASGVSVNSESAMRVQAVYSCVLILAQSVAQTPIHQFEKLANGQSKPANHYLSDIVCDEPNEWMTDYDMKQLITVCLCLRGNSVWLPSRFGGQSKVRELIPIHPDLIVGAEQDEKYRIFIKVKRPKTGEIDQIPYSRLLHFRGLSTNGFWALNPIEYAREMIGLAISAEKHGAKIFSNGARLGGILTTPNKLSEPAAKRLMESFNENYASVENAHKTVLLEEGTTWNKITMTAEDAQFLESRKYQRSEIAGWFRVPSHLINDLEKATFSNVEHLDLSFVKHALTPYFVSIEKTLRKALMTPEEKKKYFFKFNADALLRGDIKSRYEAYSKAVGGPWMVANEVRGLDDRNPIAGGDELLKPMNMDPKNEPPKTTEN